MAALIVPGSLYMCLGIMDIVHMDKPNLWIKNTLQLFFVMFVKQQLIRKTFLQS